MKPIYLEGSELSKDTVNFWGYGKMEERTIFRQKSLDRVASPEQLNDYIKVTTPSVWLILFATIILIVGTLFWAVFGRIQVNTDTGIKEVAPINYVIR